MTFIRKADLGALVLGALVLTLSQACSTNDGATNAVGPSATSGSSGLEAKPGGITAVQLNLSHIECVANAVEIHFVLLHVPKGATVGSLSWYNNGVLQSPTVSPGPNTGNVIHFNVIAPPGTYNVTAATVLVNGTSITLHNPGEYAGLYNCNQPVGCATFQLPVQYTANRVCLPVLGSPNSECGLLGLAPSGKDDPVASEPHASTQNAAVAIVKDGSVGCDTGQAYRFYSPVSVGQLLERPAGSGAISHVTYCACPTH